MLTKNRMMPMLMLLLILMMMMMTPMMLMMMMMPMPMILQIVQFPRRCMQSSSYISLPARSSSNVCSGNCCSFCSFQQKPRQELQTFILLFSKGNNSFRDDCHLGKLVDYDLLL